MSVDERLKICEAVNESSQHKDLFECNREGSKVESGDHLSSGNGSSGKKVIVLYIIQSNCILLNFF